MLFRSDAVPLAIFKHKVSAEQLTKIESCKPREVCLMFDRDATSSAVKDCESIVNRIPVSVAALPTDDDPNDDPVTAVDAYIGRHRPSMLDKAMAGLPFFGP
mgnify:CR=1 FL=1